MQNRLARADVPVELTWNLDDLFPSLADWEAEVESVDAAQNGSCCQKRQHHPQESDCAKCRAEGESHQHFVADDRPPQPQVDMAERHGPRNQSGGL